MGQSLTENVRLRLAWNSQHFTNMATEARPGHWLEGRNLGTDNRVTTLSDCLTTDTWGLISTPVLFINQVLGHPRGLYLLTRSPAVTHVDLKLPL